MPRKAANAPAPSTRATRSKAAPAPVATGPSQPIANGGTQAGDKRLLDEDAEDEEVNAPPVKKTRGRPKKAVAVADEAKADDNNGDATKDDEEEEDETPKGKAKGKGKAKKVKEEAEDEVAADGDAKPADGLADGDAADDAADDGVKADVEEDKPAKMKTVVKRGAAPVDPESNFVNTHQVYVDDSGEVYDGMLMQTNIGVNANKFYALQLLHPVGVPKSLSLHTRWGRVGERGAAQDKGPFDPYQAVFDFKKQFKSKTGFTWEARKTSKAKPGKYDYIERDFEEEEDEEEKKDVKKGKAPMKIPESRLQPELQSLMKLIFNTTFMNATLSSFSYDQNKAPLGKMSKATLLKGFAELKKISEAISNPASPEVLSQGGLRKVCSMYSNQYYTYIPHVFGRNPPTIIDNQILLQRELDLIDALGDMEVASKLLSDSMHQAEDGTPMNPIDAQLASLDLKFIQPLDKNGAEFQGVAKYARDTHGSTHRFGAEVVDVFRVERNGEKEAWESAGWHTLPDGDKMLLWHGSRATNFGGILKQGLRIAPPEAPVSGYMFGKGVYFADMMSKSAGYCYASLSDNHALLLLCEVAVRPFYEAVHSDYNAGSSCSAAKALATKGLGRTAPAKWVDASDNLGWHELEGTLMPGGPGEDTKLQNASLLYNEYIVYQPHQIRLRYLLRCKLG